MIKTGRVEGKETGTLEMSSTLNDLMNDYKGLSDKTIRKWAVPFRLRGQMKVLDTESSQNTMPV